jgi:hypothetical protein
MRTPKLTIAALMGFVLFAAVAFAALARPSQLAAALLFSGATVVLTIAIIGALFARGPQRAFWAGFAIGGWMYLLMQYGPFFDTAVGPYTFPTAALDVLYDAISPPVPQNMPPPTSAMPGMQMAMPGSGGAPGPGGYGVMAGRMGSYGAPPSPSAWDAWTEVDRGRIWNGTRAPMTFFRIGHSFLCVLAGLAAGLLGRSWAGRAATRPVQG